jgi:hypothetical protein
MKFTIVLLALVSSLFLIDSTLAFCKGGVQNHNSSCQKKKRKEQINQSAARKICANVGDNKELATLCQKKNYLSNTITVKKIIAAGPKVVKRKPGPLPFEIRLEIVINEKCGSFGGNLVNGKYMNGDFKKCKEDARDALTEQDKADKESAAQQ